MSELQVVVILTPASGKEARLKEILSNLAVTVKSEEPGLLQYHFFEQVNSEGVNDFVVLETYKDKAASEAHLKTAHYADLGKTIQEETLLAAPPVTKVIKPFAGFASR